MSSAAEDLTEIIGAFQRAVTRAMTEFGGHVARYMGDGALVYFGYPQAHEDDAERAVRAALRAADIVAGVALAGELSLASAISSLDWVSSHEKYGRNR